VDLGKYLRIYQGTKLLNTVFPGIRFDAPASIPSQFKNRQDAPLALAWILQHNPLEKVEQALSSSRLIGGEKKDTGWQVTERNAVRFLLKLKDFQPEHVHQAMKSRAGTGLTNQQIKDWVSMFHKPGETSPWGHRVKTFADHTPQVKWEHVPADVASSIQPHERGAVIAGLETERFKDKLADARKD
jgi:hypothetical protein